jgi:inosine/xanthosine triphosphatase
MIINVASKNPVKVEAVREIILGYAFLAGAQVVSVEVLSRVSEQPKSLEETVNGAVNRASNSFGNCDYSFGIESGLMQVPKSRTGYMNVCVCALYDGKTCSLGLSRAFELPLGVVRRVFERGLTIDDAFVEERLTEDRTIKSHGGAIQLLTRGRVDRKEYTKDAIRMALIQIENKGMY